MNNMTAWSDIISNSAMVFIDDIRLREQLQVNPALFYRKMSLYVKLAMPMLSRPPELQAHLQKDMAEPMFDAAEWTSTAESTESAYTIVNTGMIGYEVMSCVKRSEDGIETERYIEASYNPETGEVTFPKQEAEGIAYEMDFYTDGKFADLSVSMLRMFGLAVAIVWDERFSRNWLSMTMKIKDRSFETVNESNYIEKVTDRMMLNRQRFNDELRKYEQDTAYNNIVNTAYRERNLT